MPGANVIFIVRNIIDVAASYQKRADQGTWSADKDYKTAVAEWRQSIERTLEFTANKDRKIQVHVISYEDLFLQTADLRPLFERLDLDVAPQVQTQYQILIEKSDQLDARRGDGLTSSKRQYVAVNAPFAEYREILEKRLILPAQQASPVA